MTLEKIGNTELHRIQSKKINPYKDTIPIFIKLESQNPTKSIEDRMVYHIVSKAKEQVSEQTTFVSASSGNTGSSLAYVCKLLNFGCIVVTNTKCSEEKIKACRDYGAEVIVGDSEASAESERLLGAPILPSITILSVISVMAFVSILFRRKSNFH